MEWECGNRGFVYLFISCGRLFNSRFDLFSLEQKVDIYSRALLCGIVSECIHRSVLCVTEFTCALVLDEEGSQQIVIRGKCKSLQWIILHNIPQNSN